MSAFPALADLERSLAQADLNPAFVKYMLESARPALLFSRSQVNDAALPVGASKVGGNPDLPANLPWPTRPPHPDREERAADLYQLADKFERTSPELNLAAEYRAQAALLVEPFPLSFACQINLAELSSQPGYDPMLPREGRLLVFVDTINWSWGKVIGDQVAFQVIWDHTPLSSLVRTEAPPQLCNWYDAWVRQYSPAWAGLNKAEALKPFSALTVTHHWRDHFPDSMCDEPREWFGNIETFHPPHSFGDRLGGWPDDIQDHPETDAQLASSGTDWKDYESPEPLLKQAAQWRHLLSIAGESWEGTRRLSDGDGNLYILLREEDLKARRFENAWVVYQCT